MLKQSLRPWLLALCAGLVPTLLHAGAEGDPKTEAPQAVHNVAVRFGAVDAVSGQLSLHVPLGPRLPGRIPMGFTWWFENQDGLRLTGGNFKPVVWPGGSSSPLTTRVVVEGTPIVFYTQALPVTMPSSAQLIQWATDRGVFPGNNATIALSSVLANSDGTHFLATFRLGDAAYTYRTVVLTGDQAIWTDKLTPDIQHWSGVTHISNRWGDHVTITETVGAGHVGAPGQIVIRNENQTSHTITLTVTGPGLSTMVSTPGQDTITVTNTIPAGGGVNLPTVTMVGTHAFKERKLTVPDPVTGLKDTYYWDPGFFPASLSVAPAGGAAGPTPTAFKWTTYQPPVPGDYPIFFYTLDEIDHGNGLVEAFTYAGGDLHASVCWNMVDGKWQGLKPYPVDQVDGAYYFMTQVSTLGAGTSEAVKFFRSRPYPATDGTRIFPPSSNANFTTVLHYASASPQAGDPCRGLRLTHPTYDASYNFQTNGQAYLFVSTAVMAEEQIHGLGTTVDGTGHVGSEVVDQVVVRNGWDAHSWGNPNGTTAGGMPVNLVGLRTVVTTPKVSTRTTIAGIPGTAGRDTYGPVQTDQYTEPYASATAPAVSGVVQSTDFSGTLALPANGTAHRQGAIQRPQALDGTAMALLDTNDSKTLDLATSPGLRFSLAMNGSVPGTPTAVASVTFGTTTYGYTNGLVTTVTGARGGFTSVENRSYGVAGQPLVTQSLRTLSDSTKTYYANGVDASVSAGETYTYGGSPFYWKASEQNLSTGAKTTYDSRDGAGRELQRSATTSTTDPTPVVTQTAYDAFGRVASETRAALGTVGAQTTAYAYDANGLWKEESTTVAGSTVTVHHVYDGLDRETAVYRYVGAGPQGAGPGSGWFEMQTFGFDGFGQKVEQSPVLKAGQAAYGNEYWTYDEQGRVVDHYDRVVSRAPSSASRLLSHVITQPTTTTLQGVTGIWTTVQDDRGFTRSECHDVLGQKVAVIDQLNQLSTYTYDGDGHLLQTVQGGQLRSYVYNAMGWLTSRTEPEEGTTFYSQFTLDGRPLVMTLMGRSGGASVGTTTMLNGWLAPASVTSTVQAGPGAGSSLARAFTYDAPTHRVTGLSETTSGVTGLPSQTLTETYGYDALDRLTSKTVSDGVQSFTVSRVLDDAGNELSLTYPATGDKAAQTLTTAYDARLRPTSVSFGGAQRGSLDYEHAFSGSAVTSLLTLGNGATTTSTTTMGELTHVTHSAAAGALEDDAATWTAGGLLLSRGADSFGYDAVQRLISASVTNPSSNGVVTQSFAFDRWGNRTSTTTSAPAGTLPSPSEALTWTATYTAGSNDLPATVATGGGSLATGVQYDDLGRQTQVWAIPGQASSLTQWTYDPTGRVVKEAVNGVLTTFLLDGEGLRFKRVAADGTPSYTVYGFHRDPLARYTCPLGQVHSGSKAVQIFHKTSNNSSLSRALGTFNAGDTITVTAWFRGAAGTTGQVYLGNVSTVPSSDVVQSKPAGTGTWQQVTLTKTVSATGPFRIYLYGNTNSSAPDLTSSNYDDVAVSSTQRGTVLSEGFESGLTLGTDPNSTTAWYSSGEPTDIDVSGQPGMAEWQKSMVYGFGQLLSEDQVVTGTIYEQGDQVGSPNLITNASGTLINRTKNLPFGERLLLATPNTPKSIRRFTNHEDEDGSAIYMQARTYLPSYGKFAQVDPAYDQTKDDPESWNLYSYVQNSPTVHLDPNGMEDLPAIINNLLNFDAGIRIGSVKHALNTVKSAVKMGISDPSGAATTIALAKTGFGVAKDVAAAGSPEAYGLGKALDGAKAVGNASWEQRGEMLGATGNEIAAAALSMAAPTLLGGEGSEAANLGGKAGTAEDTSPLIDPAGVAGRSPGEIDQLARDSGLVPKGPDPMGGKGSYVDPVTGKQRVLIHPESESGPHAHVNNPTGQRLDAHGRVVHPESPEAHLPLKKQGQ